MRKIARHNLTQTERTVTIRGHVRHDPAVSRAVWEACRQQAAAKNRATEELLERPDTPVRRNDGEGVVGLQGEWVEWRKSDPALAAIPQKIWRPGVDLAKAQMDAWESANEEQLDRFLAASEGEDESSGKPKGDRSGKRRLCPNRLFCSRKRRDRSRRNVLVVHVGIELLDRKTVRIHGIADIRLREALPEGLKIRSITLVERTPRARGRNVRPEDRTWDARIATRVPAPLKPLRDEPVTCGIDHGVVHAETITSNDGTAEHLHYDEPDAKEQKRYKKLQKRKEGCRRRRGGRRASRRWRALQRRQNRMRSRAVRKQAHQRREWANQTAKKSDLVGIELLDNANMRRSAAGSNERPGRNVRAKSGLNRKLAESSPGYQTTEQIRACVRHGTRYRLVPGAGTSITCAECGHRNPKSRESQAVFRCRKCGHAANADANAGDTVRILAEAYTGVGVSRPWATELVAERAEAARRKARRAREAARRTRARKPEAKPRFEAAAR